MLRQKTFTQMRHNGIESFNLPYSSSNILQLLRLQQTPAEELSVDSLFPAKLLILGTSGNMHRRKLNVRR